MTTSVLEKPQHVLQEITHVTFTEALLVIRGKEKTFYMFIGKRGNT